MSCKNDCAQAPRFPRRVSNRPGLARIDTRIGTYPDIRDYLLARLNENTALAAWTHRQPDDPGIALLESAAVVADILTFYHSLYANESYLRTASWRDSIAELVRLSGYRLAPGLGGRATFAVTVSGTQAVTVPRGFGFKAQPQDADKPQVFEALQQSVAYPHLSSFQLYRPRTTPPIYNGRKAFELATQLPVGVSLQPGDRVMVGVPYPSAEAPVTLSHPQILQVDKVETALGVTTVSMKGALTALDEWIVMDYYAQMAPMMYSVAGQAATSGAVQSVMLPAMQMMNTGTIASSAASDPVLSATELLAFKIASTHRHFGHNAPATVMSISASGRATPQAVGFERYQGVPTGAYADASLLATEAPLDGVVETVAAGTTLLAEGRFHSHDAPHGRPLVLVRQIEQVAQRTLGWGAQTGPASVLRLDGKLSAATTSGQLDRVNIGELNLHAAVGGAFRLRATAVPVAAAQGQGLDFHGTQQELQALQQRPLMLAWPNGKTLAAQVLAITPGGSPDERRLRRVTLDRQVSYADFPHDDPLVTVYGNLVETSQGETQAEAVLGDGDRRQAFQTFALPKTPLTYFLEADGEPAQRAELSVYVNGILWNRRETLFGAGPDDAVYVIREDADGNSHVQFGEGLTGARLPSGKGNVSVVYRVGSGAHGPLKAGTQPAAASGTPRLAKVALPAAITGGAGPEAESGARLASPLRLQSLGRIVSLADLEAEALGLAGVLKAGAAWAEAAAGAGIVLTVLTASESPADAAALASTLRGIYHARGPGRYPLQVIMGRCRYVTLKLTVGYAPDRREADVRAAVMAALGAGGEEGNGIAADQGLFSMERRRFGETAHVSQVTGAVQRVAGVNWVLLKAAQVLAVPDNGQGPHSLVLPASDSLAKVLPCQSSEVLALSSVHLLLTLTRAEEASAS